MASEGRSQGKVGRVIEEYGLEGFGEELEARWTGERGEQSSLRALADLFNRRVLEAALSEAGVRSLDGEVENRYRLLTDDDVSAGMREQTRRELDRAGVPIEEVESDFVSHQSIYTYLTQHREATHPSSVEPTPEERRQRELDKIGALITRTTVVTEDSFKRLASTEALSTGISDVFVDVQVTCAECGRTSAATTLLEEGGCSCRE
ncbi:rod-determining factor RdfA [Halalkalicoccus subterraneus]|uniref:rod-determining factor RdfA n=1 Tax=Halalkalicoccus subterraneus TaxID=2675002 RepID=UPI000EFD5E8A|nr:rod-determining factor RdfA [Halalkalicoccus subterraneus]